MTNHDPVLKHPPTSSGSGLSGIVIGAGDIEPRAATPELHIPDFETELEIGTDSSDVSPHEIEFEWMCAKYPKQDSRDDDSALGMSVM